MTTTDAPSPAAPADGWIDRVLTNIFGRSWRTTCGGITTTICGIVVVADQFVHHPALDVAAKICIATGMTAAGVTGIFAKDARVSGLPK